MKIKGSKCDYQDERADDLMMAYQDYIRNCDHISMPEVFRKVVCCPAKRFWVSTERASVVICRMMRGDKLPEMRKTKREMYQDIYNIFLQERNKYPTIPITHLIARIVRQPAPRFYLSPGSARLIILKRRKIWRQMLFQKLQH